MIGIILSVMIIFVLVSLSLGLEHAIQEEFRKIGTDKFYVQPRGQLGAPGTGGAVEMNQADLKVIEGVQGVKRVATMAVSTTKIEFNNEIRYYTAIGLDVNSIEVFFESGGYEITDGRNLRSSDTRDLVVGSQYKYNNYLKKPVEPGDTLLLNDEEFKVRGILSSAGNPSDDRQIYMNEDEFREFFNVSTRIDAFVVQIEAGNDINAIANKVEKKLRFSRDVDEETQDFTILTPEELLASFGNVLNILTGFLLGVATISLVVGGIGVANTMYTSVIERTKEIGVMKAIGAKNSDIVLLFSIEAGVLGLIGGAIGVALGWIAAETTEAVSASLGLSLLQAVAPIYLIVGCLAFAFLTGAISGLWPAWKASKIRPVVALRYE